jgi:plastocyanin
MISPSPEHGRQGVDYEDTTDVQNPHAASRDEERDSRVTINPFSLWVLVVCGVTIFFVGFFSSRHGQNFSGTRVGHTVQSQPDLKTVPATPNVSVADHSTGTESNGFAAVHVIMRNMKFSPASIEIKPGETVEWTNEDITPHTATSAPLFDSGSIDSDKSWRHTFTEPGNFPYTCTFHPDMKGTVTVK